MALDIRQLEDNIAVSPQIVPEDIEKIVAAGFKTVICNRPNDEESGQPTTENLRAALEDAGLTYIDIPIDRTGIHQPQIDQFRNALSMNEVPVLAFCRTGTRSSNLWAFARANEVPSKQLLEKASKAGYNIISLKVALDAQYKSGT